MSLDHDDYATFARIEDHLRRIADALEATGRESRQVDLTAPTDDDLGEYPALRCGVYGSPAAARWDDCETRTVAADADPLDESDHRVRHLKTGEHLLRRPCGRWHLRATSKLRQCSTTHGPGLFTLTGWAERDAPLTFCDCDDTATVEAENGATD